MPHVRRSERLKELNLVLAISSCMHAKGSGRMTNEARAMTLDANKRNQGICPQAVRAKNTRRAVSLDEGLLGLLKRRDPRAASLLVKRYRDRLFSIAARICKDPADAEEVLQDVYMIVLKNIDRFQEKSALGTWLHRITVNTSLMKLRGRRRWRECTVFVEDVEAVEMRLESEGATGPRQHERSPEDILMSMECCERILKEVDGLPEFYRSVLEMRVLGLSTKETSRVLNASPAAVKSRLHRCRSMMRKRLEPHLAF